MEIVRVVYSILKNLQEEDFIKGSIRDEVIQWFVINLQDKSNRRSSELENESYGKKTVLSSGFCEITSKTIFLKAR